MCMLKNRKSKLLTCLVLAMFVLSGCGKFGAGSSGDTEWEHSKTISSPIKVIAGSEEVILGSLDKEGVEVIIPANTFSTPTEVTLANPEKNPKYRSKEMTALGAPIDISAGDKSVRLQELVTIKMKFDPTTIDEADLESGSLYFGYFNGNEWDYIKPTVDMENKIMTFTTSHFSLFGTTTLSIDQRIEEYTNNQALADWAQEKSDDLTNSAAETLIDHILQDKLGIADESVKGKVLGSLLKDDEWGEMVKSAADGDLETFNRNLQVLVGKKIVENVTESTLSKALGALTSDFGLATVEKASEAAAYLAEGQYTNAAQIIGEHIADQFMITTAGKIAVAAIQNKIESWKNEEVEAAYQVFKNGATSKIPWWGYNVEKGNFEELWSQMGGAARQLQIEAIADQEQARKETGMPPLDDKEKEKIRQLVKQNLQKQFEQRIKNDAEIDQKRAEYQQMMDMFKNNNFLDKGRWGWDRTYELEQRLDILLNFRNKVLQDIGRTSVKSGFGITDEAIGIDELTSIYMEWFGTEDPQERQRNYAKYLKENFGISLYPTADKLNGSWPSGTFAITSYNGTPEDIALSLGCDATSFNIDMTEILDSIVNEHKSQPAKSVTNFNLDENGAGTMTLNILSEPFDSSDTVILNVNYSDGLIEATTTKDGVSGTFIGDVTDNNGHLSIQGTFSIGDSDFGLQGSWSASK